VCAAEVACNFFLGRFAFLLADDHAFIRPDSAEAGDDRRVIAEMPIAVQLTDGLRE
jgi:hypothetical protein